MKTLKEIKKYLEKSKDIQYIKGVGDENSITALLMIQNDLLLEIIERLNR